MEGSNFLNSYMDLLEDDLPSEISRICSNLREIDLKTSKILQEASVIGPQIKGLLKGDPNRARLVVSLQQILIDMQDLNDEKINLTSQMNELIEAKCKVVNEHKKNEPLLDISTQSNIKQEKERAQSPTLSIPQSSGMIQAFSSSSSKSNSEKNGSNNTATNMGSNSNISTLGLAGTSSNNGNNLDRSAKRARRTRTDTGGMDMDIQDVAIKQESAESKQQQLAQTSPYQKKITANTTNKKKKKKVGRQNNQSNQTSIRETQVSDPLPQQEETIDPDEPTYCLCEQISFGYVVNLFV